MQHGVLSYGETFLLRQRQGFASCIYPAVLVHCHIARHFKAAALFDFKDRPVGKGKIHIKIDMHTLANDKMNSRHIGGNLLYRRV